MRHHTEPQAASRFDPEFAITEARREFGEHGGVAPSIERSSTFTVMDVITSMARAISSPVAFVRRAPSATLSALRASE